jgi:ketosteroid isomerase-like protein
VGLSIFKKSQVVIKPKEIERVQETKLATMEPPLAFPSLAEGKSKSDEKPSKSLKSKMSVKVKKVAPKEINKKGVQERARAVSKEVPKVEETRPTIQESSVIRALTVVQSETPVDSSSYAAAGRQFVVKAELIDPINAIHQRNQINQKDQIDQRDVPPLIKVELQAAQFKPPPLIATEEDVRKFFADYIKRYSQKDLDGFLSLFSPRAIQNRQDGLERIRKIYANFFNQSQEIDYRMNDIKTEIYQNGVEVKARYELLQVLKKGGGKKAWRGDIRWVLVKEDGALKILSLDYQPQKSR